MKAFLWSARVQCPACHHCMMVKKDFSDVGYHIVTCPNPGCANNEKTFKFNLPSTELESV